MIDSFAFRNVDYIVHTATLKQVQFTEYNPLKFIKTIFQNFNIVNAAINNKVKKMTAYQRTRSCKS